MSRKIAAVWISLVMLFSVIVIIVDIVPPVKGATITVDDDGPADFATIQEGVNAANPGDTVFVYNGIYFENVVLDKRINLTGEDKNITKIDGGGNNDVVKVFANWVNITGFAVENSGSNVGDAGIKLVSVSNCTISNNKLLRKELWLLCNRVRVSSAV